MSRAFKMHRPGRSGAAVKPLGKAAPAAGREKTTPDGGKVAEIGGPSGPEPTRYGDWERKGICVDF